AHADDLIRLFPAVHVDPSVLFVDDEATESLPRVVTAAGNAAGIDALLHLVRSDHGSAMANKVARSAVVAPWRDGGQAQFIERVLPTGRAEATLEPTRQWALGRLEVGVDLPALAEHAGVSVRTFTRRFREETGETAGRWLTRARTDLARNLLEGSDLPVDRVAARAGFGTTAALRLNLGAETGLSPIAYRRRFRVGVGG
ncbi:MAG: helix-turn-helix domain-containing protein, partial [Nakamurella sp.]